jgi:hypothetical protein
MMFKKLDRKDIRVGMQIRSLADPKVIGTVVKIVPRDDFDCYITVAWSNGNKSLFTFEDGIKNEVVAPFYSRKTDVKTP